jgi:hypothetical protein
MRFPEGMASERDSLINVEPVSGHCLLPFNRGVFKDEHSSEMEAENTT